MKTLSEGGREDCVSGAGLRLGRVLLLFERGPARSIRDALTQLAALSHLARVTLSSLPWDPQAISPLSLTVPSGWRTWLRA